jgi:hypothetical protein
LVLWVRSEIIGFTIGQNCSWVSGVSKQIVTGRWLLVTGGFTIGQNCSWVSGVSKQIVTGRWLLVTGQKPASYAPLTISKGSTRDEPNQAWPETQYFAIRYQ